jgi:hypothetical protein
MVVYGNHYQLRLRLGRDFGVTSEGGAHHDTFTYKEKRVGQSLIDTHPSQSQSHDISFGKLDRKDPQLANRCLHFPPTLVSFPPPMYTSRHGIKLL